jgi:serine/threonine protein kinase
MSSRTITSVVTADTIALNAAVFGYAGHSIVTPHQAIQQIWWTDERIESKVTREFIVSKLRPNEREQLNRPVAFGDGLTDDTYLDWILRKAKRLYLILVECGVSDQIFGIVEEAWEDDDLPISLAEVDRLALSYKTNQKINKKFYDTQFKFLLRPLSKRTHVDYAPNEVIPVEFVHRLPPAAALQTWSRLHLPKKPEEIFVRRKLSLGEKEELDPAQLSQFLADIDVARSIEHDHIAPVWASWTSKGSGYWTTPFVAEHTLKSFIEFRTAASLQKLTKQQRHSVILDWLHCLADAVASLHYRGMCHGAITPSNILIDASNQVAFSDIASLKSFHRKQDQLEVFNYGAPENHTVSRRLPQESPTSTTSASRSFFGHRRAKSSEGKRSFDGGPLSANSSTSSSGSSSDGSNASSDSQQTVFSRSSYSPLSTTSPTKLDTIWSKNAVQAKPLPDRPRRAPPPPPLSISQQSSQRVETNPDQRPADIFSLGCVFLDVISFIFKKKTTEFVKHRSTKHKNASGKGSHIDSSFHGNTVKINSWMELLEEEARTLDDQAFRCVPQLFRLIRQMLHQDAQLRPSAREVRERLFDTLVSYGGLSAPHCSGHSWEPEIIPLSPSTTVTSSSSARPSISGPSIGFPYLITPLTPPKSPISSPRSPTSAFAPAPLFAPASLFRARPGPAPMELPPLPPVTIPQSKSSVSAYGLSWMNKRHSIINFSNVNYVGAS